MTAARLLYVMGRGHSGSTVLDALVGNAPRVVGVGELVAGMLRFSDVCSCGDTIEECEFWREVRRQFEVETDIPWSEAARLVKSQAHVSRFPGTLFAANDDGATARTCEANQAIVDAIAAVGDADVVVDSSKEFTRALLLARYAPAARILHLVRSPHQVLASLAHRMQTGQGFSFLRRRYRAPALTPLFMVMAASGWFVGNLLGELVRRAAPGRVLRVRFEDLCTDCEWTLDLVGAFADIDLYPVARAVARGEHLPLGHKLAGNQMRRDGTFVFEPARMESRDLSWPYVVVTSILTWPLLQAYGYSLSGRAR